MKEKKKTKKPVYITLLILLFCIGLYVLRNEIGVQTETVSDSHAEDHLASVIQEKKILAGQHCGSCHMLPDPSLLDKMNWQIALADMAPLLGISSHNGWHYSIHVDIARSYYPSEPAVSPSEWQSIIDYYTISAPSEMPPQSRPYPIKRELPFFEIQLPPDQLYRNGNTATFVKIDTTITPYRIFAHHAESNTLYLLDENLQITDSIHTCGPVVDMDFQENDIKVCVIGPVLMGSNEKRGSVLRLQINQQGQMKVGEQLFDTLARPVQIKSVDINGNHKKDYLISEFGLLKGGLVWMENQGNEKFIRHDIRPVAGAVKGYIQENRNGLPDIWALFAQGEEGIFLFTNKGDGIFDQKQVLRFPPTYGSTSFELVDFNNNGFLDILYTAGDRGDDIPQLKPYHGVYVFLNNGNNEFTKEYFFPVNGAVKAIARDFNGNGKLDIAVIGYFIDKQQPEESFVFLKNQGNFDFQPYSLPPRIKFERALSMDVADINGNGKPDIILGNGFIENKFTEYKEPLFIVLKNIF